MKTIYDKKYTYSQVKAICELFKYNNILNWDYEDIIQVALRYDREWQELAKDKEKGNNKVVYNEIGNPIEFLDEEEYAYEQAYYDRRIKEDYLL